jgi:hypothetical protein
MKVKKKNKKKERKEGRPLDFDNTGIVTNQKELTIEIPHQLRELSSINLVKRVNKFVQKL